jgi:hypothetical protein
MMMYVRMEVQLHFFLIFRIRQRWLVGVELMYPLAKRPRGPKYLSGYCGKEMRASAEYRNAIPRSSIPYFNSNTNLPANPPAIEHMQLRKYS